MKCFSTLAVLSTFLAAVTAQGILIGYPSDGTSVQAGSEVTIEIDKPNTLSGSIEVAIVIGILSCTTYGCRGPTEGMGTILYNGPYNPQYQQPPNSKPPHQNFTLVIPSNIAKGQAQLGVTHVSLIGALAAPFLQTRNITLNVV